MDKTTSRFLRTVSFRQLQVFESIARTGSFTSAARELYLTQPTVSMQMKKLEEGLGVTLFDQVGRKIFLTDEGRALLESCEDVFRSINKFEEEVAKKRGLEAGELSISGVTTTEYFIPLLLSLFYRRYPMVNIRVTINDRDTIINRILENRDDLYLLSQVPAVDNLHCELYMSNPLVMVCNPEHPLARESSISLQRVVDENILLREENSGTCIALQNFLEKNNFSIKSSMRFNSNEAIKQGVINNLGAALLSIYAVHNELHEGRLTMMDVEGFPLQENWYIVHHERKNLSPMAKLFKEFAMGEGRKLISSVTESATSGLPNSI